MHLIESLDSDAVPVLEIFGGPQTVLGGSYIGGRVTVANGASQKGSFVCNRGANNSQQAAVPRQGNRRTEDRNECASR
jgi:hypothetical protein